MNVTVPFSFGALPAQNATDVTSDEEILRLTRRLLVPLSMAAAAVCAWALVATLAIAAPGSASLEVGSAGGLLPHAELHAAMTEGLVARLADGGAFN